MKATRLTLVALVVLAGAFVLSIKQVRNIELAEGNLPTVQMAAPGKSAGSLLLFNRQQGCLCAVKLYQEADSLFNKIDPELTRGFDKKRINMEETQELGVTHRVVICPTLIVLDAEGRQVLRQEFKLDRSQVEAKLRDLLKLRSDSHGS